MRVLSRILIIVALSISLYLAVVSLTSGSIAGCGGGSPCDKVLNSGWSYIGKVPVSIVAVLVYGFLIALSIMQRPVGQMGKTLIVGLASCIVLTVLWFVMLQVFVLRQICPFCMTSHLFGSAGVILYTINMLTSGAGSPGIPLARGFSLGAIMVTAFVFLQITLPKPDRSVEFDVDTQKIVTVEPLLEEEALVDKSNDRSSQVKESLLVEENTPAVVVENPPVGPAVPEAVMEIPEVSTEEVETLVEETLEIEAAPEEVEISQPEEPVPVYSIHGGEFAFPMNEIPGIGDWKVPNTMLNLIDFACDHCRKHYRILRKRAPWYEEEIFFGVLPLALNERCNPYFSMPGLPDYANCEYARLALAVWRMSPQHYVEYVDWLCEESSPPASLDASRWVVAKAYAENLIGKELLEKGWEDPWVDDMMNTLTELYGYNLKLTGQGAIPQQFLNQKLRFGEITTESSFNMTMGLNFPIEIKRRR